MIEYKNIKILPNNISSKIAAGEIVERPSSIVKELIENSIDANATKIIIQITNGGLDSINVIDDGIGIPRNELHTSLIRFATSKISNEDDLSNINSLGFRGEALYAISSVSSFSIASKFINEQSGTVLNSEFGENINLFDHPIKLGTSITVKNIFHNLPARKKFLKSSTTELNYIKNVVVNLALGFPNIQFQLLHNSKKILFSSGNGNLLDVISEIYNINTSQNMFKLINEPENLMFNGYISNNIIQNNNRKKIKIFVNGRSIEDKLLTYAIESGYKSYLNERKYPTAIINLSINPSEIDINIHPSKHEIKFINHQLIFSNLERLIRKTILSKASINSTQSNFEILSNNLPANDVSENISYNYSSIYKSKNIQPFLSKNNENNQKFDTTSIPFKEILGDLNIIGQLKKTYILTEGKNALYIIDQHAAHERIVYDSIKQSYFSGEIERQKLLESIVIEINQQDPKSIKYKINILSKLGYQIEQFGETGLKIISIPRIVSLSDPSSYLYQLIDEFPQDETIPNIEHKYFSTIACHSSVKAGDVLSIDEMNEIIQQLKLTKSPFSCPHGRPTILNFSFNKIEKDFRRIN